MDARKRYLATAGLFAAVCLVGCGGLPRQLREQITAEKQILQQTEQKLRHSQGTVRNDMAHSPDLFKGAPVATAWPVRLQAARGTLDRAKGDLQQLDKLAGAGGSPEQIRHAEQLLGDEKGLRLKAASEAESVEADANSWLDFEKNLPHYLATMQREYDSIHAVDLAPVTALVQKAGQDWPAKRAELETRLAALKESSADADRQWQATETARQEAAAGTAKGAAVATLIQANDLLQHDEAKLTRDADQLRASSGQLYNAWDKVLADLEVAHRGGNTVYTEKLTTVKTHYLDVATKKTEVSSDTQWVDIPASTYRSVENDLGMTIAHKDAGQFDTEALNQPQPPGFAYIASPEVGRNQYGYWNHEGGNSVWTWLPEYLVMRELLWGHSYRPVYVNEFNGYQMARRSGQSYYGRETPASPPKYGSHGTFTAERYSSSRYVQSGGYAGSAYSSNSSNRSASAPTRSQPGATSSESSGQRFGHSSEPESGAGKRFGGSSNGQRFGSGSGSSSGGQRFGAPHSAPRMPGRSFGRRR